MSNLEKDDLEQNIVKKGPGELLQVARIEQSISIEDIARQMNLNAKILQSIEDDDYSDIQSPIFIRGYLRTYARLVGLNEDEMIKLFADFYKQDDPAIKSIGNTTPEISSNDIRVKWMTYAVILGLVVLLSVWWVNNYRSNTLETEATQSVDEVNTDSIFKPISNAGKSTPPSEAITQESNSFKETINLNAELPIKDNSQTTDQLDLTEKVNSDETVEEEDSVPVLNNIEVISDNIIEEVVSTPEIPEVKNESKVIKPLDSKLQNAKKEYTKEVSAPSGSDIIELNIVAASWGSIKDASGFKMMQDLLKTGTSYRLVGKAPFKVFLGNGYGVEITLNGTPYDFSKFIKSSNNTARFELEK